MQEMIKERIIYYLEKIRMYQRRYDNAISLENKQYYLKQLIIDKAILTELQTILSNLMEGKQ